MRLAVLLAISAALGFAQVRPVAPDNIQPAKDEQLILIAHGAGYQIYNCQAGPQGGSQWVLAGPDAQLMDDQSHVIGRHFAGPTWQSSDGSSVKGNVVATAPPRDSGDVPLLLLAAVDHSGPGVMSRVTSIQRLNTKGGQPPSGACSPGQPLRVHFTADYYFYAKP